MHPSPQRFEDMVFRTLEEFARRLGIRRHTDSEIGHFGHSTRNLPGVCKFVAAEIRRCGISDTREFPGVCTYIGAEIRRSGISDNRIISWAFVNPSAQRFGDRTFRTLEEFHRRLCIRRFEDPEILHFGNSRNLPGVCKSVGAEIRKSDISDPRRGMFRACVNPSCRDSEIGNFRHSGSFQAFVHPSAHTFGDRAFRTLSESLHRRIYRRPDLQTPGKNARNNMRNNLRARRATSNITKLGCA